MSINIGASCNILWMVELAKIPAMIVLEFLVGLVILIEGLKGVVAWGEVSGTSLLVVCTRLVSCGAWVVVGSAWVVVGSAWVVVV